eukprot:8870390-Heterocapsa_arctica.AAC.1
MQRGTGQTKEKIKEERENSLCLLVKLLRILKKAMKDGRNYIYLRYDWTRHNAGWGLDVMNEL